MKHANRDTIEGMSAKQSIAFSERAVLLFFWKQAARYKKGIFGALLLPLGFVNMSALMPYFTGKLLAALGTNPDQAAQYLPYIAGTVLIGIVCNRYGAMFLFRMQAQVQSDLQKLTLDALMRQSAGFHNNRVAGKLVSDAIEFPQAFQMLSGAFLISLLPLFSTIIVGVSLVAVRSWLLGLLLLTMVTVTILAVFWHSKQRRPLRAKRLEAQKAVTAHLADTIVNNQTVKTFGHEDDEMRRHHELNTTLLNNRLQDWTTGAIKGSNRLFGLLAAQFLFAVLIIDIVKHDPSMLAVGIFAYAFSITLFNNMFSINGIIRQIEDAFLQSEPMFKVIHMTPSILDKPDSPDIKITKGSIHFNNVRFAYKDSVAEDPIFEDLKLSIKRGEKIGLVGSSGGGKTTLTRLLLRFNDIQKGTITIDGQDIANVTQSSLRKAIAFVPQEPLMFHRSVAENIAYGNLTATKEQIVQAAKQANAHEFIEQLPDGYDTLVGERGVKLSGGQRQRIAIARAILKDAPILVLDEATSALDSESELAIQQALGELIKGRTTIVIAHRLSTIQKMDRIIVLEDGAIAEEGTHGELLRKKGRYAKLWGHQSGGFMEE